jgi:hypothetical protein
MKLIKITPETNKKITQLILDSKPFKNADFCIQSYNMKFTILNVAFLRKNSNFNLKKLNK